MNFKKFWSIFKIKESLKSTKLDGILDKISRGETLTNQERSFLDNYEKISENDLRDYKMLDRESTFVIIKKLIESGKKITCNLTDRNGKIGIDVKSIEDDFNGGKCEIILHNNERIYLYDKFFYNVLYSDGDYSLEIGDEFFEKIPLKNDNI